MYALPDDGQASRLPLHHEQAHVVVGRVRLRYEDEHDLGRDLARPALLRQVAGGVDRAADLRARIRVTAAWP